MRMRRDLLQGFDESGEQVGHSAADLWAVVSQSSLVQKRHLLAKAAPLLQPALKHAADLLKPQTHQNVGDVLRLHDEELIVSHDRFKKLQRHGGVLVAADATGHQLRTHTHISPP